MQKTRAFIFLVYDAVNIYSLLTAIQLFSEGQKSFFYTYISFFSIKKLITLILSIRGSKYWAFNLYQIGFIYALCNDDFQEDLKEIFQYKMAWTLIQQMTWFIFICCLGKFEENQISSYAILASYLTCILNILILITIHSLLSTPILDFKIFISVNIRIISRKLIITLSYYLTIFSLTFYEDNFGINLGYYQLILMLINYLILTPFSCFSRKIMFCHFHGLYFEMCIIDIDYSFKDMFNKERNIMNTISFFNTITKISLLIAYSFKSIYEQFEYQNSYYSKIRVGFVLSSISLTLIYILIKIKGLIYFVIYQKYFNVNCDNDLEQVKNKLNKKSLIKYYQICLLNEKKEMYYSISLQNTEQLIIEFWQAVSYQLKKKNVVDIIEYLYKPLFSDQINQTYNIPVFIDLIPNIEIVHPKMERGLNFLLKQEKNVDHWIFQRIDNGYIFNEYTFILLNQLKKSEKTCFMLYLRDILAITTYFNLISNFMLIKPAEVLYDLYSFDNTNQPFDQDFQMLKKQKLMESKIQFNKQCKLTKFPLDYFVNKYN